MFSISSAWLGKRRRPITLAIFRGPLPRASPRSAPPLPSTPPLSRAAGECHPRYPGLPSSTAPASVISGRCRVSPWARSGPPFPALILTCVLPAAVPCAAAAGWSCVHGTFWIEACAGGTRSRGVSCVAVAGGRPSDRGMRGVDKEEKGRG